MFFRSGRYAYPDLAGFKFLGQGQIRAKFGAAFKIEFYPTRIQLADLVQTQFVAGAGEGARKRQLQMTAAAPGL